MSEERVTELKELLKGAELSSGFMGLSDDELKQLSETRKSLSLDERARLFRLWDAAAGTVLYDAGNFLKATIEIDDSSSRDRERCPHAIITLRDGLKVRTEKIDILESVRSNSALIGHPVILHAIRYWEQVVNAKRILTQDDIYHHKEDKADIYKAFADQFGGKQVRTAERNLKAIGKALWEGIQERAIPKEAALELKIGELGIDKTDTFLYKAWELLAPDKVNPSDEVDERINKIEAHLKDIDPSPRIKSNQHGQPIYDENGFPVSEHSLQADFEIEDQIPIWRVIDFLKEKGRKYVEGKETENRVFVTGRPTWAIFNNSFASWHLNKGQLTVKEYREEARKQNTETEYWKPSFRGEMTVVVDLILDVFASSLVQVTDSNWETDNL